MQVTIERIFTKEEISQRTNKKYTSLNIKTREHGDAWLYGFKNDFNSNWKEGDVVNIDVSTSTSNGKTTLRYSQAKNQNGSYAPSVQGGSPTPTNAFSGIISDLENVINKLKQL